MNINDAELLAERVRNVDFAERLGVGAAIGLLPRGQPRDDSYVAQADDRDFVFSPVAGVNLVQTGNINRSRDSGEAVNCGDKFVRAEVNDVESACACVRGEETVILVVDREVVEVLAARAGKFDDGYLLQRGCGAGNFDKECA